ncbi:unnamed protein product [Cylicostephanus goldi]|uniref:Uncharacterized protein n=1 Tax=Cylicostephanus goldi TaxID=71465 RepID=A0A3P6SE70_CYLGO|nr:unnamed protein product [Cylicostephanus goldi]
MLILTVQYGTDGVTTCAHASLWPEMGMIDLARRYIARWQGPAPEDSPSVQERDCQTKKVKNMRDAETELRRRIREARGGALPSIDKHDHLEHFRSLPSSLPGMEKSNRLGPT